MSKPVVEEKITKKVSKSVCEPKKKIVKSSSTDKVKKTSKSVEESKTKPRKSLGKPNEN